MSFSQFDLDAMQARINRNKLRYPLESFEPSEREVGSHGLHSQIESECRRRLWPVIHSRTDKRSTTGAGSVDFVIAADGGRTFWIELKSKTGKQTTEQRGFQMMLERNGHPYFLVRSFSEFLQIVGNSANSKEKPKPNENPTMDTKIK